MINNFFANIAPETESPESGLLSIAKNIPVKEGVVQNMLQHPIGAAGQLFAHEVPVDEPANLSKDRPQFTNGGDGKALSNSIEEPAQIAPAASVPPRDPAPIPTPIPIEIPDKFSHLVKDRIYTEWITNLRTIKHGLNQTFRVYIFLGDFNPDPSTWPTEYNVVGRFTVLGRESDTSCEKCQQDRDDELIVTGTVPLTSALLQDIVAQQLGSLEPGEVQPYLERHLHWRVTVFDGSEVPRDQVPGLKVSVVSTQVRIGDDAVPVYSGVYEQHPRITDGRPAGLSAGDAE